MAGITPEGFEPKTSEDLLTDINARATSEDGFGPDFPTSADSVFGIHTWILIGAYLDLWNLGQSIADNQNRDTAEGVYLDYLAGLIGISRLPASGSTGFLLFEGRQNATVQSFFPVSDTQGRNVLTQEDLTLNRSVCYNSRFSVNTVVDGLDYTVVVEGDTYTHTADEFDTAETIIDALVLAIGVQTNYTGTKDSDLNLLVTYNTPNNILTTTNSSTLDLVAVGALVTGTAADVGTLDFPANTITRLVGINLNIDSVTNPFDFIEGRFRESDEDLRDRMEAREQATGTATKPSIETSIAQVDGVTSVLLIENDTMNTVGGIPPKAYETFVVGGSDADIGKVVWETKPAAIETHGTETVIVIDQNGDTQAVKFSRKVQRYAHMRVDYSIDTDTSAPAFPADGEDQMKQAVVDYGDSLLSGEDYIPSKFYGPLYTVPGVVINTIEIAVTPNAGDTPTYQSTTISIEETENLNFDISRVTLTTS